MRPPVPPPPSASTQAHADRRMGLVFDEQLRCYPDPSLPPHAAHAAFHSRLRAIGRDVDERCGGLLHLELAENKVGGRIRKVDGIPVPAARIC